MNTSCGVRYKKIPEAHTKHCETFRHFLYLDLHISIEAFRICSEPSDRLRSQAAGAGDFTVFKEQETAAAFLHKLKAMGVCRLCFYFTAPICFFHGSATRLFLPLCFRASVFHPCRRISERCFPRR